MNMIKTDEEHFKKIYIYLVDGSRYSIDPLNNKLVEYVIGNFCAGYNIGISKNEAKSISHEWFFEGRVIRRQHIDNIGVTGSNIISIEILEHEEWNTVSISLYWYNNFLKKTLVTWTNQNRAHKKILLNTF